MLVFGTAPGFDRFFRDTGTPAVSHTLPAPATEAPDLNTLVAAARKHGVEVTGPPPVPSAMNA
jgi:hypothetical protein